jgi:hypothetical protein
VRGGASGIRTAIGVRSSSVHEQVAEGVAKGAANSGPVEERGDEVIEEVVGAHRDAPRRDRRTADTLGGMRTSRPGSLSTFHIGNHGRLTFVRTYDVDATNQRRLFWVGSLGR